MFQQARSAVVLAGTAKGCVLVFGQVSVVAGMCQQPESAVIPAIYAYGLTLMTVIKCGCRWSKSWSVVNSGTSNKKAVAAIQRSFLPMFLAEKPVGVG